MNRNLTATGLDQKEVGDVFSKSESSEETLCLLKNYQMVLDEIAIVAITDINGSFTYINNLFCKLSQYTREEILGHNQSIFNMKMHPQPFFDALQKTISSGSLWFGVIRNQAKDGSFYMIKTTIFPFKNSKGEVISYVAICTDITEDANIQRKAELTQKLLDEEKENLKRKSIALNELLNHLDEEKNKVLNSIKIKLETTVFPFLNRAIEQDSSVKKLLEIVKLNLKESIEPTFQIPQKMSEYLTPKEIQFCSLIRQGLTVKEIALLTRLSPRTIDKHRENIRKKLNITERKINLGTYLVNLIH